jgi:septal ring factor EnvC (AmiA/AmiB activator)
VSNNDFIASLNHLSWIIQIKQLKQGRRNDLEKLLSIFDQENLTKNHHILNVDDEDFPEAYRTIIRRLRMAFESEDIQIEMEMEDDYMKELQEKERLVAEQAKSLQEQAKSLREKDKVVTEQAKSLQEKEKVIEEKEKSLQEQAKEIEKLKKQMEEMRKQNKSK